MELRPSRRQVLKASAGAVGAGVASTALPPSLLRALAATSTCGNLSDIEHVIIFIQENRSFDYHFGRYKSVRGFDDRTVRMSVTDDGTQVFLQTFPAGAIPGAPNPLGPFHVDTAIQAGRFEGECTNDIDHQWATQHAMWNDGKLDSWVARHLVTNAHPPDQRYAAVTMGYEQGSAARDHSGDNDLYWALADNFTICDNYYCSVIGGTDINRLYSMTGTADPDGWDGGCQFLDTKIGTIQNPGANLGTAGKWKPYPELLEAAGISWKVYGTPDGHLGDNVLRYFPQYRPVGGNATLSTRAFGSNTFPTDFVTDCAASQLPRVSWIVGSLVDTEHAPAPSEWAQDELHTVVTALMQSPLWPKSVLFYTYDENGGFFDHVPPPVPLTGEPGEFLDATKLSATALTEAGGFQSKPIGLGFRVPLLVISPFTRNLNPTGPPIVCSDTFDHTSLLLFLERISGVPVPVRDAIKQMPGLSPWRKKTVGDLTSAFNFAGGPLVSTPGLPLTNHADPRVLAECPSPAGTQANVNFDQGYPVPASTPIPTQESSVAPLRPSGPVPGQPACPPLPNPSVPEAPFGPLLIPAGAAALVAAWLVRRNPRPGGDSAAQAEEPL